MAPPPPERVWFPSRRGNRLAGILHRGRIAGAAVILCHGMESTKEGTKHRLWSERLSSAGFTALRFDFSYVGESEGEFADLTFSGEVDDLGGAWDFVRASGAERVGLIGSSMGGTVALLFAASEPRVRAVAVVAAVARPARMLAELRPAELDRWRKEGVASLAGVRLKRTFLDDVESLDVAAACRRIACPTLVVHGDADRVVPLSDGEEIAAALAGEHRLEVHRGADHRFSKPADLDALVESAARWMVDHLAERA